MSGVAGLARAPGLDAVARRLRAGFPALVRVLRRALLIERDRLALWLPVCLGIGDLVYFASASEPPRWPVEGLAVAALLGVVLSRGRELVRIVGAALLAGCIGFLAASLATERAPPMPVMPRKAAIVSGRIAEIQVYADGARRVVLGRPVIDGAAPLTRRLRMRLRADDAQAVAVGDTLSVRGMLRAPPPPSLPGGRDLQREAFFDGLAGSGYALNPAKIVHHPAAADGLAARIQRLRETIAARILRVLPGARGAIAATLLTGISSAIPPADRQAFAVAGLAHLLAVAGLHLGIVMGLVMGLLRMGLALWEWGALRLPTRQIAAVGALIAGGLYMTLTGMHLPTIRSLAMATLAVVALMLGRRPVSMRGLGAAAVVLLLTSPEALLEVSFQMSFAAVLALIAGYEALRPATVALYGDGSIRRRFGLHVWALFMTSLLAGAASTPYAIYHFGHVQFYFVLANLVAVPMTALWVLPEGLLSLALMPFGLERIALLPMGWGIGVILWLAHWVAALPASSIVVPAMPLWGLGVLSFGLIWLCLRRGVWRLLGALPLCVGVLTPLLCRPPDLLVSADARLIGLRVLVGDATRLMLEEGSGASAITLSDWSKSLGIEAAPDYMPERGSVGSAAGPVTCDAVVCRIVRRGQTVLLLRQSKQPPPALDCAGLALIVSPMPAHACRRRPRIDRFTVWREGAQAVWIGRGGVRIVSDQQVRGWRPWIPVPGQRRVPNLPMAKSE
ncbi:ComEC/Rec2 family competence protein [Lichenicoccus sp.]|uniref:ComEC/Rec2 family competence protein n=1 Tax=Lichenicoccus sp. TaxID=2781899 RepID=UPI003D105E84